MCGRVATKYSWQEIHDQLDAFVRVTTPPADPVPRYNVAPTQMVPVLRADGDGLAVADMRWDFVPQFWREPLENKKWSSFNAKVEEAAVKPAFRLAIKSNRCLVPVSAFYEWKALPGGKKQPYAIGAVDSAPMLLGSIWSHWKGVNKGQPVEFDSFAICTTAPNAFMAEIHNRMPVIIQRSDAKAWVFGDLDTALDLAKDYPSQLMRKWPVSPSIGNVRNQGPEPCAEIGIN